MKHTLPQNPQIVLIDLLTVTNSWNDSVNYHNKDKAT